MVGRARERTNSGIIILFSDNVKPMGFVGTEVCEVAVLSFTVTSRPYCLFYMIFKSFLL